MESSPKRLLWEIAGPMIVMSGVLLGLGFFSAWNVYQQQRVTSDLIAKEVHSVVAIEELNLAIREIRYLLNLYLRSKEVRHLDSIALIHSQTDLLLQNAKRLASTQQEQDLLYRAEAGYDVFFEQYSRLTKSESLQKELESLSDNHLTDEVIRPLQACIEENESVVDRTNLLSKSTSRQLAMGLLLLGVSGGAAGVLSGIAVARAVGRSIVQLNVSVQSVASRLSNIKGPVSFTAYGGTASGIQANLKALEQDIEEVIQAFQQKESALLRSEQLARVGQMAAGLAHELRNPLMPMKMLVQAALHNVEKGDENANLSQRSLQILNDEILRLEQTIQSFLDFARPNQPKREWQDVTQLLESATQFVSARMQILGIQITTRFPDRPVMASVDKNQIRQLFLNLLQNAMDAMPGGGKLLISIQAAPEISITFHDSGSGIPEEIIDQIFEPFVTTKETGTGLGLSICRQIATAHGGDLVAFNSDGALFQLTLNDGEREHPSFTVPAIKSGTSSGGTTFG